MGNKIVDNSLMSNALRHVLAVLKEALLKEEAKLKKAKGKDRKNKAG
jgi:hypothetical protein